MNTKTTFILLALLIALAGGIILLNQTTPPPPTQSASSEALIDPALLTNSQPLTITINHPDHPDHPDQPAFTITRTGTALNPTWRQTVPVNFPLDPAGPDQLLDRLGNLTDTIALTDDDAPTSTEAGLDEANRLTITITFDSTNPEEQTETETLTLHLGKKTLGGKAYLQLNDTLYLATDRLHNVAELSSVIEWRSKNLALPELTSLQTITLQNTQNTFTVHNTDGRWFLDEANHDRADRTKVNQLYTNLRWTPITRFVADSPNTPEALADFGLNNPTAQITFTTNTEDTTTLSLGLPANLDQTEYFATLTTPNQTTADTIVIFAVEPAILEAINLTPADLRQNQLISLTPEQIKSIRLGNRYLPPNQQSSAIDLTRNDLVADTPASSDTWKWSVKRPAPSGLDQQAVIEWIDQLLALETDRFEPFPWDQITASMKLNHEIVSQLTIQPRGEAASLTYNIYKAINKFRSESERLVYVVPDQLDLAYVFSADQAKPLLARPLDLNNRHIFDLDPQSIQSIQVTGAVANSIGYSIERQDDGWQTPAGNAGGAGGGDVDLVIADRIAAVLSGLRATAFLPPETPMTLISTTDYQFTTTQGITHRFSLHPDGIILLHNDNAPSSPPLIFRIDEATQGILNTTPILPAPADPVVPANMVKP